jgi:hypothetical protein
MKGTVILYLLTVFVVLCLAKEFRGERLRHIAVYTGTAVLAVLVLTMTNHSFLVKNGISESYREEMEFPPAHFLMMAMNPETTGAYNGKDVDYTKSFKGKNAKKDADLSELKNRLNQMGVGGTLEHIFLKKARYIYGTGTAGAPSYIVRAPVKPSKMVDFLGHNTGFFEAALTYKAVLEAFVLLMTALFFVKRREEDGFLLALKICLIGMFLFFCIWESHPRYTFLFLPIIGMMPAEYVFERGQNSPA